MATPFAPFAPFWSRPSRMQQSSGYGRVSESGGSPGVHMVCVNCAAVFCETAMSCLDWNWSFLLITVSGVLKV